jgi:hypothetical protein
MYFFIALSTLSSLLFAFLITRQWFEPEYETLKYLIGWYGLKTYTKINKYIKKIYKIKNYFYGTPDSEVDIHFISNGEEVLKISNKDSDLCKINTYDFIFYEIDKEDEPNYMVIRDKLSKELASNVEDVEKSNVRFLAPQLMIGDYSPLLMEFAENIYLVDNKLFSRPFITWYMKTEKNYLVEDEEYSIRFFDNKMDLIQITSEECVILGKDTYEIVKYEREEAEEEMDADACDADAEEEADEVEADEVEADEAETEEADDSETEEAEGEETDTEEEIEGGTCETGTCETGTDTERETETVEEIDLTPHITQ